MALALIVAMPLRAAADEAQQRAHLARILATEPASLQAFYAARDGRLAWRERLRVAAFADALSNLDADGLNPDDYHPEALLPLHHEAYLRPDAFEAQARLDVMFSQWLHLVLHQLHRGKLDPAVDDPGWALPVGSPRLDPKQVAGLVDGQRFEQVFALARPTAPPYERLRAGLARYRQLARAGGWPQLPAQGPLLRAGDRHAEVALLRERLIRMGELQMLADQPSEISWSRVEAMEALQFADPELFDEPLEEALKRFQRRHWLDDDGILGPATRAALNVTVQDRIDQIRLNLERARWLLHGLPSSYVLVDIAGYRLSYVRPGGEVWRSRIVVGQPYRRTPSLRSKISHMTLNPSWTVPPTIMREDVLPAIVRDPDYLVRQNMQVLDAAGREIDPGSVNWAEPGRIFIRQRPGPGNALGRVVIRFPNEHLVYLHDTPAQGLFSREQRAFSSGCIRVERALEFAQLLLDDSGDRQRIDEVLADGRTRDLGLRPVPLLLHYWTVSSGVEGELEFRPDVYGRDAAVLRALKHPLNLERAVEAMVEMAGERPADDS